jgi:hypothetical protein
MRFDKINSLNFHLQVLIIQYVFIYNLKELTGKKLWQSNRTLDAHLFRQGEDFTIHIAWTLFNRVDRVFPVNITSAGETKFLKYQMPYCLGTDLCIGRAPNFIQV